MPFSVGPARATSDFLMVGAALLFGLLLAVIGCSIYARDKAWPRWLAGLGVIPVFGVLIMIFLPDRSVPEVGDGPRGFEVLPLDPASAGADTVSQPPD